VKKLLEIVDALSVIVEELKGDAHRIAGVQLAQIADVDLGGESRVPPLHQIVVADADEFVGFVDGAIE
jgi:hypothetical protein